MRPSPLVSLPLLFALSVVANGQAPQVTNARVVLAPFDAAGGDAFGTDLGLDGDLLVVGAPGHDARGSGSGAAYVYRRIARWWFLEEKLLAPDGSAGEAFGKSVAVAGNRVVVGAPSDTLAGTVTGSAYVFRHDPSGWVLEQKLQPLNASGGPAFGRNLTMSGNRLAGVGQVEVGVDGVFVYVRAGNQWTLEDQLSPTQGVPGGWSNVTDLDLQGDRLLAGASSDFNQSFESSGSATTYGRQGSSWVVLDRIEGDRDDGVGYSVALARGRFAIGSVFDSEGASFLVGSVSVFRDPAQPLLETRQVNPEPTTFDRFGQSIDLSRKRLAVGTPLDDDRAPDAGAVYVFEGTGPVWSLTLDLNARDGRSGDHFGEAVALERRTLAVGAPGRNTFAGGDAGMVYLYELP